MNGALGPQELEQLTRYISGRFGLRNVRIVEFLAWSDEISFDGSLALASTEQAQVAVTLDLKTARNWLDRLRWIEDMTA